MLARTPARRVKRPSSGPDLRGPRASPSMGRPPKRPEGLVSVLLDRSAGHGERAMDLGACDEPEAEEALLKVALDPTEGEGIADSAGESPWRIWERKGKRDAAAVARMHPAARKSFDGG